MYPKKKIYFFSGQTKEYELKKIDKHNDSLNIEFYLFPNDNFKNIKYSVIVKDGVLVTKNHSTINGTKIPLDLQSIALNFKQLEKVLD